MPTTLRFAGILPPKICSDLPIAYGHLREPIFLRMWQAIDRRVEDSLYELVRSHAAIDPTDIHVRLSTMRASSGFPAPSFLSVNQGLSELRKIHSEAALVGYCTAKDAAAPMLTCTLQALASEEGDCSRALGRLLRSYKHAIDQARMDACQQIEGACAARLIDPSDTGSIREIYDAAEAWTSLCRPLLAWNADHPDRQLSFDTPVAPLRRLLRAFCDGKQFRAAIEVTAATREIFAAVPTTLDQLTEDARLFAAMSAYRNIEQLQRLVHDADIDASSLIAALETSGFGETSTGPAKILWRAFMNATTAPTSLEPFRLVHGLAVRLSNRPKAAAAVVALITGLIRHGKRTAQQPKMLGELRDNLAFMRSFMGAEVASDEVPAGQSTLGKRSKMAAPTTRLSRLFRRNAGHRRSPRDKRWGKPMFGIGLSAAVALCAFAFYFGLDRLPFWPSESSATATRQAAASLDVQTIPSVGTGQRLALEGVRYCHYQQERLRFIKQWITAADDARAYNLLIVDYNSRCSDFFYKDEDLKRVEAEVNANKDLLEADARRIASAWPGHGSEVSSKD